MPRPKVLIAEDSATVAAMVMDILDTAGYDVIHAAEGESALDMARHEHPHVVLTDFILPLMDGIALCKALRADPSTKDVKIIMMTSLNNPKTQAAATEAGANAFLGKPIQREILLHAVNVVLLGM